MSRTSRIRYTAIPVSLLEAAENCVDALAETSQHSDVVRHVRRAIAHYKATRSACGKAGSSKGGRPPRPLPWDDIDALRRRRKTWKDIAERLDAAGFRITYSALMYRNRHRHKRVVTVTRG